MTIALPAFQRGQGTLAAGLARSARARTELERARESALAELRAAFTAHDQRARLADTLARDALPSVTDNEMLARRSFEAGEMNLMDLLLVRRDALDTRAALIDRRLDAARSRLRVDDLAGVLR